MGLALKSLTGSRRIIELLNRMGHCINYHGVTEIETEMTYESRNRSQYTPYGMDLVETVGTGVAWDNYDRFVETSSGKDTLHDTVGITYQIQSQELTDFNITQDVHHVEIPAISTQSKKRKRRSFEPSDHNMQPYRKKPKITNAIFLPENHERKTVSHEVIQRKENAHFRDVM